MTTIITGENVLKYRLLALKSALKLETKGLKHSKVNVAKIVKGILAEAGIKPKAKKIDLLAQFEEYLAGVV
jgi:hypothetical protein